MSIKLKGSTDGSVTLQAPADTSPTGTDKTLTLPTTVGSANQFLQNGSTAGTLEFGPIVNSDLPALTSSNMPAGSVLQVVQYQRAGQLSPSNSLVAPAVSAGFVNMMSKSITTKVTNSKILVMLEFNSYNCTRGRYQLLRGSTQISGDPYAHYTSSASDFVNYKGTVVDDPQVSAGTSITYTVQVGSLSGSCAFGYGDSGGRGATSLILVEIAP
tara:strand:- start:58 stop:699 length:642 start_codon:yes stop_codon:yes gene_type:complete